MFHLALTLVFLTAFLSHVNLSFSSDIKACLKCHSIKTLNKITEKGEKISLYVDKAKYEKSIHGALDCSACHPTINVRNHPRPRKIQSRYDYTKEFSPNCLNCHPQNALMKPPIHGVVVKRGEVQCSQCHGNHYIPSMKEWKNKVSFNEYCMSCHRFEFTKTLPSKEKISVKVDEQEIKRSVHGKFQCIVCHSDFSKTKHPIYDYKDKRQYRAELNKICTKCHTERELKRNQAHYAITKTATCIECHGYHGVKPVQVVRALPETQYCQSCHSRPITMKMKNGEVLSAQVRESDILSSAHRKLKCTDCHKDYSPKYHPIKVYDSIEQYRAQAKEICNLCHQDAVKKYDQGIHALALKRGNKQSPDCIRCHDYHKTKYVLRDKSSGIELCIGCHGESARAFKESVHHKAFTQGKAEAPTCVSCHNSHDVFLTSVAKLDNSCGKCHKDMKQIHNKWLYNPPVRLTSFVETHFSTSSCASCHTKAEKSLILSLFDRANKKPMSVNEVSKILGIDPKQLKDKIDSNRDGRLQQDELWQLVEQVRGKSEITLLGKIDVFNPSDAHRVEPKSQSIRECSYCHNPHAKFRSKLEILREDAVPLRIEVDREAINSYKAIPNVRDFYVLSLSKIEILDTLFLIALIGGLALPLAHITLRVLTAPIRKRKEVKR